MAAPSPIPTSKLELRCYYRDTRNRFVLPLNESEKARAAQSMKSHLETGLTIRGNIAGYAAFRSEIDPIEFLKELKNKNIIISLPYFADRNETMEFREWEGDLVPGPWGIMQPDGGNKQVEPDIIFVPLIAVDLSGNRLGQGQGHYDRALAKRRKGGNIVAVGLAWECQIAASLPADPWDEPLDYICTPERLIEVRK